ncbi:hypothetical protein [Bradyrhizobium betae]|uniref:HPF/RaiA family ribosome-associated protein n=1 Tax=Bradyrhizobium betae TaxID=244734 RepID=A0A5P6PCR0_9BRAD|nr:hypothetical protein [Bradyrhizobium betae]MCS3729909.1 hypothetical protein [Bradyrhizobium betae]QFI75888.1 hypothetical protein F8237_27910 [Bradyrhizobium betae]
MLIEVRTAGTTSGEQSFAEVKAEVHAALDQYGDRLRRIDVHLSDAAGRKSGHDDKSCMIEARRDGCEPIVVTHLDSTMEKAIHGAIHDLKRSVQSALGKEAARDQRRDHH